MNFQFPKHVYLLIFMSFLSSALTFVTPLFAPLLILYAGLNEQSVSLTLAFIFLVTAIFQPFIGYFLDQGYHRITSLMSFCLLTVGIILLIQDIDSPVIFVLAAIALIIALKMIHIALNTCLLSDIDNQKKGDVYLLHYLAFNLGFCAASVLAYHYLKNHRTFLFVSDWFSTALVIAVVLFFLNKKSGKIEFKKFSQVMNLKIFTEHQRRFLALSLIWLLIFSHTLIVPLIYHYNHLDILKWTTYLLALNTGGACLFGVFSKKILKNMSETELVIIGCGLMGLGYFIAPYCLSLTGITLSTLLIVIGEVMLVVPQTNVLYRCFSNENTGLVSGINAVIGSFGRFLCPCLSFVLFKCISNINAGFAYVFGLIVPLCIVYLLWPYLGETNKKNI